MDGLVCIASRPEDAHRELHRAVAEITGDRYITLDTCERLETFAFVAGLHANAYAVSGAWTEGVSIIRGKEVVRRLMRIAAGLESRIVGEPHVLGQVRAALIEAQVLRPIGTTLSSLFRAGIRTGRRVRNETRINTGGESVVSLTTERLLAGLRQLDGKSIGVVGSGALAQSIVQALRKFGADSLRIYTQSPHRARAQCLADGATIRNRVDLGSDLADLHAIVACSRSPQPFLHVEQFQTCRSGLMVIDLGSPANVEVAARNSNRMTLTRLTDLRREAPAKELAVAEEIIEEELDKFQNWYRQRKVAKTIQQLVRDADLPPTRSTPALHEKIMKIKSQVAA